MIVKGIGVWAGHFLIVVGLTDILDGWLARRTKQESPVGALLDPVADKILLCVAVIFLVARNDPGLSPTLATLILVREFFVSGLRAVLASFGVVMGAGRVGKIKTFFQFCGLVGLCWAIEWKHPFFSVGALVFLWSSVFLSYASMLKYSYIAYQELKSKM